MPPTMTYEAAREKEIKRAHARRIDDFARKYMPGRPTVVLLPGGMGSQLDRSDEPYRDPNSIPFDSYDPVWIDWGILSGDALYLEICRNGHDLEDHIITQNGYVTIPFQGSPYNKTEEVLENRGYNFIVCAFDWRRSLDQSARFLEFFLRRLRARVKDLKGENPLPNTTLLCHSMGGLVAKAFLHRALGGRTRPRAYSKWMSHLVTVGTPFYGTENHMARYYKGQELLNGSYGTREIAQLIGTLPGPYVLMFLDRATFKRDGKKLGLKRYPVRDAKSGAEADPYDNALFSRYPPWVNRNYLKRAREILKTVTRPLPKAFLSKVFHIRSVGLQTRIELSWAPVDGSKYDPDKDPSPIRSLKTGAGDGTVPAWAARLAEIHRRRVHDLKGRVKHIDLMEDPETLSVVSQIIDKGRLPRAPIRPPKRRVKRMASRVATQRFLTQAGRGKIRKNDPKAWDPKIWRRIIAEAALC